jgi:hypothetical protein
MNKVIPKKRMFQYINLNLLLEPTNRWRLKPFYEKTPVPYEKQYECRDFKYIFEKKNEVKYAQSNELKVSDKFKNLSRKDQYECHDS